MFPTYERARMSLIRKGWCRYDGDRFCKEVGNLWVWIRLEWKPGKDPAHHGLTPVLDHKDVRF